MAETPDGNLWIATAGGGLNKLNTINYQFSALTANDDKPLDKKPLSNLLASLYTQNDGQMWIGYGNGAGLSIYSPSKGTFRHFKDAFNDPSATVRSIRQTPDGKVWLAVENEGLFFIDSESDTVEEMPLQSSLSSGKKILDVVDIEADADGTLWIATLSNGIINLDPESLELRFVTSELLGDSRQPLETYVAEIDARGRLWVGSSSGIYIISAKQDSIDRVNEDNSGIPDDQVLSIFHSEQDIVWVGTYSGLAKGTPSIFEKVTTRHGLPSNDTNAFAQTSDGTLWIATDDGLAYAPLASTSKSSSIEVRTADFRLPASRVMSLLGDGENLWAGTINNGLFYIDRAKKEISHFKKLITKENSLSANGITSILKLDPQNLLIGTYGGGLNKLNTETGTFVHYRRDEDNSNAISSDMVIALLRDSAGKIWVGTENGLNLFNPQTETFAKFNFNYDRATSLSSDMAWALHEDAEGNIWIGTQSGGLNKWEYKEKSRLHENFIQYSEMSGSQAMTFIL